MPEVTLDVVSVDSTPVPDRSCHFTGVGGTIGRDEGNTMVLQDKHRRVSRLHASITFPDGVATIANASTTLPISVGSTVLNHGEKVRLNAGDSIEIGPFILRVKGKGRTSTEDTLIAHVQPTVQVPPIKLPEPILAHSERGQSDPLASLMSSPIPGDAADPFADLFADLAPINAKPVLSPTPPVAMSSDVARPIPVAPLGEIDPFADLLGLGPSANAAVGNPLASYGTQAGLSPAVYPAPSPERFAPAVSPPAPSQVPWSSSPAPLAIIPEDFNPFALPSQTSRNAADPLAQMMGGASPQADVAIGGGDLSIDALFSTSGSSPFEGLVSNNPGTPLYPSQGINSLTADAEASDPLLMFGASAPDVGASMYAPVRDDLPEIGGAYQPPKAFFPESQPPRGAQAPAAFFGGAHQREPAPNVNADALTSAFMNAVGLPPGALPGGLTPELMTVIGGLLRTATSGAIDMLAARAATKLELQASVTIISSQSNNPLKFLPNAESALQQMLGKKMPGFMRADQAMRDAFDDLRAHEIGVIAGTRAALTEVLGRFDPSVLEKRLTGGSLLDSFLPAIRKTKLWEIYLEQYAKIRREAEDDFQSIFGRSFLEAYEQETNRVKSHATHSGSN
jgi:FHA domain-containing protein